MSTKKAPIQGYTVEESVPYGFDVYLRISKDKDDNTTSLITQREECRKHCREEGIPIGLIFEEDFTGTLLIERKVLGEVRKRYMAGKSMGIIFWKFDRFTRVPAHFHILLEEMKRYKVKYVCVKEHFDDTPSDVLTRNLLIELAAYERSNILLRTSIGTRARAEIKGKTLNGGKSRYGFDFSEDRSKRVINEKEAETVVDIFTMRANRQSIGRIVTSLNDRGIPSPTGKKWEPITVTLILEAGKYWYRGIGVAFATKTIKEYKNGKTVYTRYKVDDDDVVLLPSGTVPRIISDDLYFKAMAVGEIMKQDSSRANKNPEAALLRGGFLRCGVCGAVMTASRVRKDTDSYIYVCGRTYKNNNKCLSDSKVCIYASKVDQPAWDYVLSMVKDVNIVCEAVNWIMGSEDDKLKLEKSTNLAIENCDRKVNNYRQDLENEDDQELRAFIYSQIKEQLKSKKVMEKELAKIRNGEIDHELIMQKLETFVKWCEKVRCGENEEVEYKDKRDRLRFLGIQVFVYPEKDTEHERFEITTRPDELVEALESSQIEATIANGA